MLAWKSQSHTRRHPPSQARLTKGANPRPISESKAKSQNSKTIGTCGTEAGRRLQASGGKWQDVGSGRCTLVYFFYFIFLPNLPFSLSFSSQVKPAPMNCYIRPTCPKKNASLFCIPSCAHRRHDQKEKGKKKKACVRPPLSRGCALETMQYDKKSGKFLLPMPI